MEQEVQTSEPNDAHHLTKTHLVLISTLLILAISTLFVTKDFLLPATHQSAQTTAPVVSTITPINSMANPDSIGANWKTYTNTRYGYSIQYPADQYINCFGPGDNKDEFFLFEGKDTERSLCTAGEIPTEFYIIPKTKYEVPSVPTYEASCVTIKPEEVVIDGKKAAKYSKLVTKNTSQCSPMVAYSQDQVFILLQHNNTFLEIYFKDDNQIKNQILSTFRFLGTSRTKIYQAKEFAFNYPSNRTLEVKMSPDGSGFIYFNRNDDLRHSILSLQIQPNTQSTLEDTIDTYDKEYTWKTRFIGKTRVLESPEMYRKTVASYSEYQTRFFSKDKTKLYIISWRVYGNDPNFPKEYEDLIASLKFTY